MCVASFCNSLLTPFALNRISYQSSEKGQICAISWNCRSMPLRCTRPKQKVTHSRASNASPSSANWCRTAVMLFSGCSHHVLGSDFKVKITSLISRFLESDEDHYGLHLCHITLQKMSVVAAGRNVCKEQVQDMPSTWHKSLRRRSFRILACTTHFPSHVRTFASQSSAVGKGSATHVQLHFKASIK